MKRIANVLERREESTRWFIKMKRVEKERRNTRVKGGCQKSHPCLLSEGRGEYWKRDRRNLAPDRA